LKSQILPWYVSKIHLKLSDHAQENHKVPLITMYTQATGKLSQGNSLLSVQYGMWKTMVIYKKSTIAYLLAMLSSQVNGKIRRDLTTPN